jgi:circadian clock protein KaiB
MTAMLSRAPKVALKLFVAGATPSAERAKAALSAICDQLRARDPACRVDLDIHDVLDDPDIAVLNNVFATPTVIRMTPGPTRRLFGDLSSPEMVMIGLQLAADPVSA